MHRSCFASQLAAAASLLLAIGLAAAVPAVPASPAQVAPRCGTTYYPTIQQQLVEATPDTVGANTAVVAGGSGAFCVAQTVDASGALSGRVYQLVAFDGIPAGAYGCQLAVTFPADDGASAPQLSVTAVLRDHPAEIVYPNNVTFAAYPAALGPGGATAGAFGTVTAVAGTTAVVNTESCDTRLAFVFSIAAWTGQSAAVAFAATPPLGVYLTANC